MATVGAFSSSGRSVHHRVVPFEIKQLSDDAMIFEGYAATFGNVDRGGDVILPGAFKSDVSRFLNDGVIAWQHDWTQPIGRPLELAETPDGLWVKAQLVPTSLGTDVWQLMKAGVCKSLSIGYVASEVASISPEEADRLLAGTDTLTEFEKAEVRRRGLRALKKIQLYDISPVTVPMNPEARVLLLKRARNTEDLPLADRDRAWDSTEAEARVRRWANAEDAPNERYAQAFFYVEDGAEDTFGAYKLQFADVIDGELTAVPRGIFAVAAALQGARGGVDIPEEDVARIKAYVEEWYSRMSDEFGEELTPPWMKGKELTLELPASVRELLEKIVTLSRELSVYVEQLAGGIGIGTSGPGTGGPPTGQTGMTPDTTEECVVPRALLRAIARLGDRSVL